ncbi:MAG: TonB-dependent receptor [Wenzhouxiangella sp.]|jgi:iron complex outermembrane receptor protein|nr:TonB-dependent receptor [Wenzhouxiangella sp.]
MRKSILFTAMSLALGVVHLPAQAQDPTDQEAVGRHKDELDRISVRAYPVDRTPLESAEPVDVLVGEALNDRRGMTLGETLESQPGVHSTYYGPGAGRPVIRGLSGPRIQILEDGMATGDASAPSDDHAISLDPLLVDQIEILRGPATLLYGSAATGGVVNVIDNRIPEQVPDQALQGRYELRGDSVADERSGVLRLDGGGGNFAWHVDGSYRDAGDYDIPGPARRSLAEEHHDDHDHDDHHDHDGEDHDDDHNDGTLENSFVESRSGTVGASWIGDRGFIGASFRVFESDYGIPAPHSHAGHDHEDEDEHGHDEHQEEEEEGFAFIDMEQNTWNLKAGLDDPLPGLTRATFRLGYSDYRHFEIEMEGDEHDHEEDHDHDDEHDHEPTLFDLETLQARLELQTAPVAGWAGALGMQFDSQDFITRGEEAFIPPNETDAVALFVLQERRVGDFTLSLGGRIEQTDVSADIEHHGHDEAHDHDHGHDHDDDHGSAFDIDDRTFTTWSASMGAIWRISEEWQSTLNFSRAQRAPSSTELFADGPHLATFSFELGDPTLGKETTSAWDLGLHHYGRDLHLELNLFQKDVKNFVFLDDTGELRDGLILREFRQGNAEFYGLEALATWRIHGTRLGDFDLRTSYDVVRGELDSGANLPRISPQRVLVGLDWHTGPWRGGLEWQRVFRQDKVGEFEGETPGYNLTHATLAYELSAGRNTAEIFLQGRNLGNNEARVHTSSLREFAPLPGRNLRVGLRGTF